MVMLGTYTPGSPEWHAARRWRIGGSEIGQVMGWSRWGTRADLLAAKLAEPVDKPQTDAQLRGTLLEPAVLAWGAARYGYQYADGSDATYVHRAFPWALYNPDSIADSDSGERVLIECKTATDRSEDNGWGRAGTGRIPAAYKAQVAWGMAVLDLPEAHVLVLAGAHNGRPNLAFSRYIIRRDRAFENRLLTAGLAFIRELTAAREADERTSS